MNVQTFQPTSHKRISTILFTVLLSLSAISLLIPISDVHATSVVTDGTSNLINGVLATSVTGSFTATSGDLIVIGASIGIFHQNSCASSISVTSGKATYANAITSACQTATSGGGNGDSGSVSIWYGTFTSSGADTITVSWTNPGGTAANYASFGMIEFSGANINIYSMASSLNSSTCSSCIIGLTSGISFVSSSALVGINSYIGTAPSSCTVPSGFVNCSHPIEGGFVDGVGNGGATSPNSFKSTYTLGANTWFFVSAAVAFDNPTVSQPISETPLGLITPQTITLSGCNPFPGTFTGDGSTNNIAVMPNCSMKLSLPLGFIFASTGSQTATLNTCSIGTCTLFSDSYYAGGTPQTTTLTVQTYITILNQFTLQTCTDATCAVQNQFGSLLGEGLGTLAILLLIMYLLHEAGFGEKIIGIGAIGALWACGFIFGLPLWIPFISTIAGIIGLALGTGSSSK